MGFVLILSVIDLTYSAVLLVKPGMKVLDMIPEIAAGLPVSTFKDHKLSIDQPTPYSVRLPETKGEEKTKPAAIKEQILIDTNYKIDDVNALTKKMRDEKIIILFTADKMVTFKNPGQELRIQSLESMPDITITHDLWMDYAKKTVFWAPVFFGLIMAFSVFLVNFIKVVIGALFAMFINLFSKSMKDFSGAMRLSAATSIPISIIFLLIPSQPLVKTPLWLAYIIFGAFCARQVPEKPANP